MNKSSTTFIIFLLFEIAMKKFRIKFRTLKQFNLKIVTKNLE